MSGTDEPERHAQTKGGLARAAALSPAERREIARNAAAARWHGAIPRATHEGKITIGGVTISCAVLEDGRRVLSESGVLRALGTSPSGTAHNAAKLPDGHPERLPMFVASNNLRSFIDNDLLILLTQPIYYRPYAKWGRTGRGLDATLIPRVCDVWLRARAAGKLLKRQLAIAERAEALVRGLAHTGIIALVDEATGYQEVRDRLALQAILNRFLTAEALKWIKRFPDEFYDEIFRLRKWDWARKGSQRPVQIAKDTINLVYMRIMPELLPELESVNPKAEGGRRKAAHHQFFSLDIGSPALNEHIRAVTTLMKAFDTWDEFKRAIDRALPIKTRMSDLPLWSQPIATIEAPTSVEQRPTAARK